ncbi:uncharacterized protein LOC110448311 [Mizuhopecten yessoensis]|nr:uncharacterized protein LOC110448311 [Mizuhopecten yessoensis]XP_021350157.1 uncharacterized protein LOC110448311 [Mizuhopecten yessoensis]XP_021350158.1 uncharacterized protein LOC110448311 [Mizuhopecten yessoensis]
MDPPADYNRYREYRDPPPDGRYPQPRAHEQWSPTKGLDSTSPSWDRGHLSPRGRSPEGFRETGFNGNMGRLGQEDRGTFFPPGGVQQPFRPLPQKDSDQIGFTRGPGRDPYQESFRGRYLGGKSRHASMSSRGSNEQIRFAYDNSGFQPKYREPDRRSNGSLPSAQRGYMFNDLGKTRAKDNYDDNNYIYRSREMANGRPGSTSKMNGTKYRQHDMHDEMKKDRPSVGFTILLRFFTCLLIFWDLANDWIVGASGPSPFVKQDNLVSNGECVVNTDVFSHLNISTTEVRTSICSDTVNAWTSLTVFMLLGSLIAIIQCINITMETISIVRQKKFFRILSGQSEIFLTIFLEEIPQAIIMIVLLFHCKCPPNNVNINLFALLASISACASAIFRLCVSYDHMTGNVGCCNQWWRCCCCRNNDYCCEVKPRDFFCTCEIPFPICCCTLSCKDCKCSPVTWCNFILKTFGCFCDCCQDKDVSYGIRLVNLFGISLLLLSVGLQIFVFVVTVH